MQRLLVVSWLVFFGAIQVVVAGDFFNRAIPEEAHQQMTQIAANGGQLTCIAFAPNGGWCILYDRNQSFSRNIPEEADRQMRQMANAGEILKFIAFAPNHGWSILAK